MSREPAQIHVVPHFHFDPVWIMDQRTYAHSAFGLIEEYLEACDRDAGYHILLSELDYLQPFMAAYSEHRQTIRGLVTSGRMSTAGAYGQPNEMSIQGEPLIRNLLYGRLYHENMLKASPTVFMPLDVFGHCLQLPQIAAKAGFQAIIWSKDIVGALPLCYALAPDGTALLQKHEHYWYRPATLEEFLKTVAEGLEHQSALGLNHDLRLLGGDMSGPQGWLAGHSASLQARDPSILLSTPDKYLTATVPEVRLRSAAIPVTARDFSWYHMGTTITRPELKIANRLAENRVMGAEKWATLAALLGATYPDHALDKAWRQILFGQHHDAVTGVSSDIPFLDLLAGYREAIELAAQVEIRALSYIGRTVNTGAARRAPKHGLGLIVFNPLGWARTDVARARVKVEGAFAEGFSLTDESGKAIPYQAERASIRESERWVDIVFVADELPSLGYRTYYLAPADQMPEEIAYADADTEEPTIENEYLAVRAEPDAGGGIISIFDKRSNKELIDCERGPANEILALRERPDREMPPWEVYTTGEVTGSGAQKARVEVLRGPVFSRLRITGDLPERCPYAQEVTLYNGIPRIDLRTILKEYRGEHEILALSFPLSIEGGVPTFEDRFAAIVRRPSCGRLDFRTLEQHNLSRCGLGAAQNWVDIGPAPSLQIVQGKDTAASVPLGPCAIVTTPDLKERGAAREIMEALLTRGVTCIHLSDDSDPEAEAAASAFRISLGRQNRYSQKLLELSPQANSRLTEVTPSDGWGGVLLRRPDPRGEWPDVPVLVADTTHAGGTSRVAELLAAEIRAGDLQLPKSCDFSGLARPCADRGMALINRGTLAASLESDGALIAPLCHTSSWSTYPWGQGMLDSFFVPDHRSHLYEHSLYPHDGDWRRGGVVRTGYEVNDPLQTCQVPIAPGTLPTTFSLVTIEAPNVLVAAMKPLGNPVAEHMTTQHSQPEKGFLLRLYESAGDAVSTRVKFDSPPEEAWLTDLLERKTADVELVRPGWRQPAVVQMDVAACEIATLAVRLPSLAEAGTPEELGPTTEAVRPFPSRYWDHNLGAAPMGNQPVTLWMRGPIPVGKNTRFSLGVSNDSLDRDIAGSIHVLGPEEWTMIPREVPYRIAAGSQAVYEIMVVVPQDAEPCFIRAVLEQGEYIVQDVVPVGNVSPLTLSLAEEGGRFILSLANPNADYVEGEVALITPLEYWGAAVDTLALGHVGPRRRAFRVGPGAGETLTFAVEGEPAELWAVAKVSWYGRVQYVRLDAQR